MSTKRDTYGWKHPLKWLMHTFDHGRAYCRNLGNKDYVINFKEHDARTNTG